MSAARPVRIAPSILSADFARLADEIAMCEAGGADWIHVDVMDGHFVPNITLGPVVVEAIKKAATRPLDVHLMIVEPEKYIEAFAKAGADILTVHAEACTHLHRVLQQIRHAGAKPAVVLNPATPLSAVEEVLGDVEMVLLMSVNPGFGGQAFIPEMVEKVRRVKQMTDLPVQVDGGITERTAPLMVEAGAQVLVAGSAVYKGDPATEMRRIIEAGRRAI